jgi:murein DD-endopeptidase MepM/ murein hydrolase activator NlpD
MNLTVFSDTNGVAQKLRLFFRDRDLIVHDGTTLRRLHVSARVQIGAAVAGVVFSLWALIAVVQMIAGVSALGGVAMSAAQRHAEIAKMEDKVAALQADIATMKETATRHAALLEKRQAFLAAVLTGQGDPTRLSAMMPADFGVTAPIARDVVAPFKSVAAEQLVLAARVQTAFDARSSATEALIARLGISGHMQQVAGASGGPYEPVVSPAKPVIAGQTDPQFRSLFNSWKRMDQLKQAVVAIPSLKPVDSMLFTSGFGIRSDPFRGGAAMHAGVDIPGPYRTPIYATADGIVERAQWANGYGNLVELNHGRGLQTRYGHLSSAIVTPGQHVTRGQLIAYMGSTGRSTGNHLHYEVRVDGAAINPMPFLQSTDYLSALQQRNATMAVGGPVAGK